MRFFPIKIDHDHDAHFYLQYFGQFVEKIEEILNTEDNIVPNIPRPMR